MSTGFGVSLSPPVNHCGGIDRYRTMSSTSVDLSPSTSGYDRVECKRDSQRQQITLASTSAAVNDSDAPEVAEDQGINGLCSLEPAFIENKPITNELPENICFLRRTVTEEDEDEEDHERMISCEHHSDTETSRSQRLHLPQSPMSQHRERQSIKLERKVEKGVDDETTTSGNEPATSRNYSEFYRGVTSKHLNDNEGDVIECDISQMIVVQPGTSDAAINELTANAFDTYEADESVDNDDNMNGDHRSFSPKPFQKAMFTSTPSTELSLRRHLVNDDGSGHVENYKSPPDAVSSAAAVAIAAAAEAASSSLFQTSSSPSSTPMHLLQQQNRGFFFSSTSASSKLLKCPNCNWHYKYRETLEIHMREKHAGEFSPSFSPLHNGADGHWNGSSSSTVDGGLGSDAGAGVQQQHAQSSARCPYCTGGAGPHPRLARGESYPCGYKPYRCDVCSYSTTTKGNLSIHMQSDRHLNNVQVHNSPLQ